MAPDRSIFVLFPLLTGMVLLGGCASVSTPEPGGPAAQETVTEALPAPGCGDGVVKDDGSVEHGYGFVPSAKYGIYVQRFDSEEFASLELDKVCVCWLHTRADADMGYEIVFYKDIGGRPAAGEPYASVPATAIGVQTKEEAYAEAKIYEVDVSGVTLAEGSSFIGVRWTPTTDRFFFICTDTSETTEKTDVFFTEDREKKGWVSVAQARDPIFKPHRAIVVRATAKDSAEK